MTTNHDAVNPSKAQRGAIPDEPSGRGVGFGPSRRPRERSELAGSDEVATTERGTPPERSERRLPQRGTRRLNIDWTRCDGHGLCHALLPEVIDLDEWGFPILPTTAVPDRALPEARRVAAACPALALRLT